MTLTRCRSLLVGVASFAATALAIAAGVDPAAACDRLGSAVPASRWRMELHERSDGLVVVNDAYNANPASMAAAVDALASIASRRSGRSFAVLGEMLELGKETRAGHLEVGRRVAEAGVDVLVTNAGGPPPGNFATTDVDAYPGAIDLNLLSVIGMCKAAVPAMQAAERRILNSYPSFETRVT